MAILKRKLSKKAQMKMFETIGVLIVFMIIFSIGINFYGRIQEQSLLDAKAKFEEFDSIKMSVTVLHLPEIVCTLRDVVDSACVDIEKARFFENHSHIVRDQYVELFGEGRIWIEQHYPVQDTIELYNLTPSGSHISLLTPHPVTLLDPHTRRASLGTLYVEKYATVIR